jgi:nucleotide-binding universal stress UspA family protein
MTDATTPGFEMGSDGPMMVVVGIDGSENSLRAAAYAAGLARRQGVPLTAVWVQPPDSYADLFAESAAAMAEARAQAEEELRHTIEWATAYYGIPATSLIVRKGDAFHELVAVAEEVKADAVVVGASTHAGHRLVGSLGLRLVRAGRWPVTVVP